MGFIRKAFQKNFERRSADWSSEKKARRTNIRKGTWSAIEVGAKIADVPAGGKVSAVMNLDADTIAAAVANPDLPEFTQEVADRLKDPFTRKAMELGQEFIDIIEREMKIDIPDAVEAAIVRRAVDALADQFDELADAAGDKLGDLVDAGVDWFKGLFDKDDD